MQENLQSLRALLKRATPGPWAANLLGSAEFDRYPVLLDAARRRLSVVASAAPSSTPEAQANLQLAAMAPQLAEQVIAQAETIAAFQQWAQSMCEQTCGPFRPYQRHAPNCPVWDLGLDGDVAQCDGDE